METVLLFRTGNKRHQSIQQTPDRDHEKVPAVLRQPGPAIKKSIYEKTFLYLPPAKMVPGKIKSGRPRSVPANICSGSTCKAP